jgi:hypothetical protein
VLVAALAAADVFELDGNAGQDAATGPEDWELLYDSGNNTGGSSVAFTGVAEDSGPGTIFAGGRKDIDDLNTWRWQDGSVPDKNDITNAVAAAYSINGDLVVYFAADRYSNTGDAYVGFWFFKDRVTLNPNGTFRGLHQVGDILLLVNYPQGSAQPEIQLLEWNPAADDVADNLHLLYSGIAVRCGEVPPSPACAITNATPERSPWPYQPKSGALDEFPAESFFEGGVNLTQILGAHACFSSFIAETRSSTSVTATLKDFVIGEFPVCGADVVQQCGVLRLTDESDLTEKFFEAEFFGEVVNSGAGTFAAGSIVTIVADAGTPGDASDDVVIEEVLTVDMGPGDTYPFQGTFYTDDNPPSNTVSVEVRTIDAILTASDVTVLCDSLQLNPGLALNSMCWIDLQQVSGHWAVRRNFSGDVTNTGDVPLLVTVTSDLAGQVMEPALLLPGDTAPFSGSYLPPASGGGEENPLCASFGDSVTATGLSPYLPIPVIEMRSASCSLCPAGSRCQ